ncbi:MAG: SpoIID/LytB domain-containing protein [Gemmatimonadota bacterium]|nr:MAG: SpoIID/LytB domain-containing protein [Gemmatimonadota bacterium]
MTTGCPKPGLAAIVCGTVLLGACAQPTSGPPSRGGREPELRVAVVAGATAVRVGGEGTVVVAGSESFTLEPGNPIRVVADGGRVRIEDRSGSPVDRLTVRGQEASSFVTINGQPYRGTVLVYSGSGGVVAVNVVGLEAYLRGVVATELGNRPRSELAAMEAQAIVSRTYALKNLGRFESEGYDIRASVSDQAYRGVSRESEVGNAAVARTSGMVVTHRGNLASVFYHSTCGYSTASPEEAFRTVRPVDYLRPVSDRRASGGYYCDPSPRFRWTVEWDGRELQDILRRTMPTILGVDEAVVDRIHDVYGHGVGPSRRITELRVAVGSGTIPVFGPDIRRVLETPEGTMLGSTAIEVTATRSGDVVELLRVSGAGYGHGVGMCQWGAIGRARAGHDAETIVTTYFPGTKIERWY